MVEENCNRIELPSKRRYCWLAPQDEYDAVITLNTCKYFLALMGYAYSLHRNFNLLFLVDSLQENLFTDCETSLTFTYMLPLQERTPYIVQFSFSLCHPIQRSPDESIALRARTVTGLYALLIMCHMKCFSILKKVEVIVSADTTCALC